MTSTKHGFEHDVKLDVEARVRQGVKAVLEEVLQDEMTQHLEAGDRELTPTRRGERSGHCQRNLVTPAGKIERLVALGLTRFREPIRVKRSGFTKGVEEDGQDRQALLA